MTLTSRGSLWLAIALLLFASRGSAQTFGDVINYDVGGWGANVNTLAVGSDGAVWFTVTRCDDPFCTTTVHEFILRITEAGVITEFPLPFAAGRYGRGVYGLTAGPDGALWYTEIQGNRIGRMTATGAITSFPLPALNSSPYLITVGIDGALWFTAAHAIGRITTEGVLSMYPVPTAYSSDPTAIAAGPDGALWFTEVNGNRLGRITITGELMLFPLAVPCNPYGITAGHDNALWFTCGGMNGIGRITVDGAVSTYSIPTPQAAPVYLTTAPDGSIWFSEQEGLSIGRITPDGTMTEYPVSIGRVAHHIVWGPGGVWLGNGTYISHLTTRDVTPPVISGMPSVDCSIWPPNHKLRRVAHVQATDESGVNGVISVSVTSSEPQLPGPPDIVVTPDGSGGVIVELRAERRTPGPGRLYTIGATAQDNAGNVVEVIRTCTVPHDQRR